MYSNLTYTECNYTLIDVFWCLFERIGYVITHLYWKESDEWWQICGPGVVVGALHVSVVAITLSILMGDFIVSQSNQRKDHTA